MSKISVVVPVYNCERYLNTCIDSILSQTFTDFELILVDDGSTDGSALLCDAYSDRDNRIKVIHKANGGGAGEARNVGLDSASSPFICFIDSDDWIKENMLEVLYEAQKENNSDVVLCGYRNIVSLDNREFNFDTSYKANYLRSKKAVRDFFVKYYPEGMVGYPWNKLYRRELIINNDIRFPKMRRLEDGIFNTEFFSVAQSCVILPDVLYYYRASQQVEQRKLPKDFYSLMETFVLQFYGKLKEWQYPKQAAQSMVIYFLNDFVCCLENVYMSKDSYDRKRRRKILDSYHHNKLVVDMLRNDRNVKRYSKIILKLFDERHYLLLGVVIRLKIFIKTKMYILFQKIKRVAN